MWWGRTIKNTLEWMFDLLRCTFHWESENNCPKNYQNRKKKCCQIFSKKNLLYNSYARITKKIFFLKIFQKNFLFFNNLPKTNLLTRAHQKGPYFSETIFCGVIWDRSLILPEAPWKKFILCSGFDKIFKKNTTKNSFFCLKTPQFQLYYSSGIL